MNGWYALLAVKTLPLSTCVHRKWGGALLLEYVVSLMVIGVVLPIISQQVIRTYQLLADHLNQVRTAIEANELYYQLYSDSQYFSRHVSGCEFETDNHHISYSIINNRFRRKKRLLSNINSYYHYLGKRNNKVSLHCQVDSSALYTIEIETITKTNRYQFHMPLYSHE